MRVCDRPMCEGNLLTIVLHVSVVRQDCLEGAKARRTGRERGFAPLSTRIAQTCLSTNPPQHLRVHTINGSRRKIGGGFLGVVTAGQKGRNGCQGMVSRIGVTYTRSRGRGWFRGDPGDRLLCFFNYI